MSKSRHAVVLLSGGIDSATTLAIAKAEGFEINALTISYGQKHAIEIEMACRCAENLGVLKHLVLDFDLRKIGGSALTADIEVPKRVKSYELKVNSEGRKKGLKNNSEFHTHVSSAIPVTYVPARNTIFLSLALAWAEVIGSSDIFIGANAVDYSGYPDCRPEYIKAFEEMANLATRASVEEGRRFKIHAPLLKMTKADIITKGTMLGLDYSFTWSCYDPKSEDGRVIPCMECDSCVLRLKGFNEAGLKDPLVRS
jgi:7-cyano-7-deazaguanine synthase